MVVKKNRSTHLLTARSKGTADRFLMLFAIFIFTVFGLCSAYAIILTSGSNAAAWSMAAFFWGGLLLMLVFEDNTFPSLDRKSFAFGAITWFFVWIFVAFLVSFLITMNLAHLGAAALFGVIVFISGSATAGISIRKKSKSKKKTRPKRRLLGY